MEPIKNVLFDGIVILGLIAIVLLFTWYILELLNRTFKFSKYIIMYHEYKKNSDLYDLKDKLVISKDGDISYSCVEDLNNQNEILEKAMEQIARKKELKEKFSK